MQVISLLGAGLILSAYFALQSSLVQKEHWFFNVANLLGSLLLLVVALVDRRWGFILLEAAWSIVSLHALARRRHKEPHEDRPTWRPGA